MNESVVCSFWYSIDFEMDVMIDRTVLQMTLFVSVFMSAVELHDQIVLGDHRVALLIDNSKHTRSELVTPTRDIKSIQASLAARGFRCEVVADLDESELHRKIESFARRTPTRGTALIYFSGQVLPGSYRGMPDICMLGNTSTAGRGYGIVASMNLLATRGGSLVNIIIADSPKAPEIKDELPEGSLVAFMNADAFKHSLAGSGDLLSGFRGKAIASTSTPIEGVKVEGTGSVAISPPDKFVLGHKAGDEWVDFRGMVFCWCPPGTFVAGSPEGTPSRYADEEQREVTIKDGFWIGKYEVIRGKWSGNNVGRMEIGSHKLHPKNAMSQSKDTKQRAIRPIMSEAKAKKLLPDGWEYALPTEEQWEYAARAGSTTNWYFGDDMSQLPKHANFGDKRFYDSGDIFSNAAHRTLDDGSVKLAKVGSYLPNPWGLHDVYGNVSEWCDNAAVRGGSWLSIPETCRSAYRDKYGDRDQSNYVGCRYVVRKVIPGKGKR